MKKTHNKILLIFSLTIILIFALCGCNANTSDQGNDSAPDDTAQSSQEEVSGTIGIYSSFPTLPVLEYPSYMSEEFSCEVKEYDQSLQPLNELIDGNVDVCVAPLPAVLAAQLDGASVKILCNFYQMGSSLVVSPEQSISSVEDLCGKEVGYTEGSMEYALLIINLYNSGIDRSSITWKEIEPSQLNSALQTGAIDAYCSDASLAGTAFQEGYGKIISYPYVDDIGYGNMVMATTQEKIDENSDWLQEIVNVNYQVMEMSAPLENYGLSSAEALGLNPEGISLENGNYQWCWDMEEEYVMFTRNLCNYLYQMGIFDEIPDMNQLFDFSFLETRSQEFVR